MPDTASKLAHLLPHWVEHSEAHLEGYRHWAARARAAGMEPVAAALEEAIAAGERAAEALGRASAHLVKK